MSFVVLEASPEHATALARLFERESCACYCRYFHFEGDKNAWLDRCANAPQHNRAEMLGALATRAPEMRGVVALDDARVIGWMKLAPAVAVEKLYAQRVYRSLPCFAGDRTGVYAIGCFLVESGARRRGLARALVGGGIEAARRWGARAIEAFPRRTHPAHDHELWTGPASIFEGLGFQEISSLSPYPVLRLEL